MDPKLEKLLFGYRAADDEGGAPASDAPKDGEPAADAPADAPADAGEPAKAEPKAEPKKADSGDWRSSITDDKLLKHAERFTSVSDLVKGNLEQREKLSSALFVPGEEASAEEVAAFRKVLGVPDKPEDYQVKVGESVPEHLRPADDDPALSGFLGTMHEAGAPQPVVAAALDWYYSTLTAIDEAQTEQIAKGIETAETALRQDWGKDYEANVRFAQEAAKQYLGEEVAELELKDGTKLGNHPDVMKGLARIGREGGEGQMQVGLVATESRKTAQERIDEIFSLQVTDPGKYQQNQDAYENELRRLHDQIYGTAEVDSTGRAPSLDQGNVA